MTGNDAIQFWAIVVFNTDKDKTRVIAPFYTRDEARDYALDRLNRDEYLNHRVICTENAFE